MLIREIIDTSLNEILLGTYRQHYNTLQNAIDAAQTTITLGHPVRAIGDQAYVEIDQEILYVVPGGVNETAQTLAVIRGQKGTTAAAHDIGDNVVINPRFPRITIMKAIQEEARGWPTGLFQVQSDEVEVLDSVVDVTDAFDQSVIRVIKVWRRNLSATSLRWIRITAYTFEKDIDGAGQSLLMIPSSCIGETIRLQVALPFVGIETMTEATDIVTDMKMSLQMADILKYGACWRLVSGRETRRLFTEAETESRLAADVPAGANLTLGRQMQALRNQRVGEEIFRLRSLYGLVRR